MFSDVKMNASVALDNLLPLVNDIEETPSELEALKKSTSIINLVTQGEEILWSNSALNTVPQADAIVSAIDKIAQARSLDNEMWDTSY